MTDLVLCLNCDSGPFELDEVRTSYNFDQEFYNEQCPICSASHAFSWVNDLTSDTVVE